MWTPADRAWVGDFGSGQALSDDQYRLIAPLIPPAKPGGRPCTTDMRRLLDGLFYVVRTGCQWRHLPPPPAFPPWPTVYGYFRTFLAAGVWESVRHHLVAMLREGGGREASPTAAVIDTPPRHGWLRHLVSGRCPWRGDDGHRDERCGWPWPGWADVAAAQAGCGSAAAAGRGSGDGLGLARGDGGGAERLA